MVEVMIDRIIVGERHRKDFGDIEALAASIKEMGLLQPIGITLDDRLVFGERRLRACKLLGRKMIHCHYIKVDRIVDGEYAENEMRKQFTLSERVAIARAVAAAIPERRGGNRSKRAQESKRENFPVCSEVRTRDLAAKRSGLGSGRNYEKAVAVINAAEENPDKFGDLVEKMDKTNRVDGAYRELKKRLDPPAPTKPPPLIRASALDEAIQECFTLCKDPDKAAALVVERYPDLIADERDVLIREAIKARGVRTPAPV